MEWTAILKKGIYEACLWIPCHRKPERCFHINGKPMPVCSRCFSILVGYLFIPILFWGNVSFWIGVACQIPMLMDGISQLKGWRKSNNFLRTVTGLLSGFGLSVCIVDAVRWLV